jgi:hypothetical protein
MAIPSFGGMAFAVITVFLVPVLYCRQKDRNYPNNPYFPDGRAAWSGESTSLAARQFGFVPNFCCKSFIDKGSRRQLGS